MSWDARARAGLGMAMLLSANAILFLFLLVAFVSLRDAATAAQNLNLALGGVLMACLVSGALNLWRVEKGHTRLRLAAAMAAAVVFLLLQGHDFLRLVSRNITVAQSPFGTAYFVLTGIHAFYVLIGLFPLALLFVFEGRSEFGDRRGAALNAAALYWYFVAAVWIAIFGVVYLWSFL